MRYVIGVFGLIFVTIIAIVMIGRGGNQSSQQQGKKLVTVTDYADRDSVVSHTTQGRLVGNDTYKSIRITVNQSERRIELLSGYDNSVERAQSYPNTSEAYKNFIYALATAGFSREKDSAFKDEKGVCPQGKRVTYTLRESDKDVVRLWSTSCGRGQGNFGGDYGIVRQLFQDQITDYSKFVSGVRL